MAHRIADAEQYVTKHSRHVDPTYRPVFHYAPPIGWINDPNGILFYRGETHVFCQYYPYGTAWGPMHWAHAVTKDGCRYRDLPVALAPDADDETGCFSGGATVADEKFLCFYTRHYEANGEIRETQALAESTDGVRFTKRATPILTAADLPDGLSRSDFRDPNPVEIDGKRFVLVGARTTEGEGRIVVFETEDYRRFTLKNVLASPYFGTMGECPDLFRLDGKDVLLVSAVELPREERRFRNVNSAVALIGVFHSEDGSFETERAEEIDCGHDFYAPQTTADDHGRRIMYAWMNMWGKPYFLDETKQGWNGALTYPRELRVRDGQLIQTPAREIAAFRVAPAERELLPKRVDATFRIAPGGRVRFSHPADAADYVEFGVDGTDFYFDPSHTRLSPQTRRTTRASYSAGVAVRMLMDTSSVELFVDGGKETLTTNFFIGADRLALTTEDAEAKELYVLEFPNGE